MQQGHIMNTSDGQSIATKRRGLTACSRRSVAAKTERAHCNRCLKRSKAPGLRKMVSDRIEMAGFSSDRLATESSSSVAPLG
jgi:hypothetical protein